MTARRDFLTGCSAAAVAAMPVTAEAVTDPHPTWMAESRALYAAWPRGKDMDRGDPAAEYIWELERLIVDTPATTLAGMLVQTELAMIYLGAEDPRGPDETGLDYRMMRSLRAGLEHLGRRAVA